MNCNRWLTALLLLVVCLCLALGTAAATAPSVSGEEQAIAAQLARDNAAKAVPSIPPLAGGIGLAALLIFGAITSRRQRTQEDMIPSWRIAALATRTAGWPARASAADAGESSPLPPFPAAGDSFFDMR